MPFRDVVGHVRVVELLTRSVAGGSLPPSLIFAGPAGVGKRLTALAVAQTLNCLKPEVASGFSRTSTAPDADPLSIDACGKCAACTRIARGMHPDVLLIEPGATGSIKIDP